MVLPGRRQELWLCVLLILVVTPSFQGATEIVCPQIGYLGSPANLTCIGTGKTHSYTRPKGGVLTTCDMNTSECTHNAIVTITNSSYSIVTLPMVNLSHSGYWNCSIGDDVSRCLFTVANIPSCTLLSKQSTQETRVRVQHYYCSESVELHLKTGNLTRLLLNTTRTNTTVDIWETQVNVQTSFEEKLLIYICGNTSREIACTAFEDKATSNRTSMEVIIGSVVAGIVIVTIIITLVVFLMKMKSKRAEQPDTQAVTYDPDSIYDVARQANVIPADVNKPSACYDYISNARYTRSPEETSLYDIASR